MKKNGFTLFEMLVVISIIAIVTATISLSFSSAQKKARDARRINDMKAIQTAAEQFYSLNGYKYPLSVAMPWTVNGQTILPLFPVDPKKTGNYDYLLYKTMDNINGATYCFCALLENTTSGNSSSSDCRNFVSNGTYFCVQNQQ